MNGYMDSGSLVRPSSQNSQTETTLEPLSRTEGLCRLQVWIATCQVTAKHLGMRAAVPSCLSGSGGRMRGTGGAGRESPRCSAAQHHDSVAATGPTGRQAGGPMRSLEAGNGGGGVGGGMEPPAAGTGRMDQPLPGASVGRYLHARAVPKQGSPWLLTRSWEEVGHGFHAPQMRTGRRADMEGGESAFPALRPPCGPRPRRAAHLTVCRGPSAAPGGP